jgi:hypothetical protein
METANSAKLPCRPLFDHWRSKASIFFEVSSMVSSPTGGAFAAPDLRVWAVLLRDIKPTVAIFGGGRFFHGFTDGAGRP